MADDARKDDDDRDEDIGDKDGDEGEDRKDADGDAEDDDEDKDAEEEDAGPPLYKRPVFWIVVTGVALVLGIGGFLWWLNARKYQSTDDAFVDGHIVRIAAQTSGRLIQVAQADNRHVHAGELLAVIEPGSTESTREEAIAGIAQADAQIRQAEAQVLSAEASRGQALANAAVPLAEAARARRDYARYLDLVRRDPLAAAPTQVDQARAQAESASAQARAAQRQVGTAAAQVLAARRQVDAARAQRGAAVARLRQSEVSVSYLRIQAPIDGQVVNRQVNLGSYVAPGQQLMAIVPDHLWVTANFKETQLSLMRAGQPVTIRVDAFPDVDFTGHVDSIQRGAGQAFQLLPPQNATGNYVKVVQRVPVRIEFDGDTYRRYAIGPGMSVVPRVTVR
jgi:membrane fusion protein, multidrug efflux system